MTLIYITGDINFLNAQDAGQPFCQLKDVLESADLIFSNLECYFYGQNDR